MGSALQTRPQRAGVGAIAKAIHRGPEPGGLLGTLVVGVLGALLGGVIASAVHVRDA